MTETNLHGIPASDGIAIGPVHRFEQADLTIPPRQASSFEDERVRFEQARQKARAELEGVRQRVAQRAGEADAAIFEAHQLMLDDPLLEDKVIERLRQGATAEQAVDEATAEVADMLAGMEAELFAARAADVRDVGRRVIRLLLGRPPADLAELPRSCVIVAGELTPSDTAGLDPSLALGICTARGGLTSHSAILARALGIPAVVGIGDGALDRVPDGIEVIVDGTAGLLVISPEPATVRAYKDRQAAARQRRETLRELAQRPAHTADGRRVEVAANVGDVASARSADDMGAEGIGLLRTEFLYLDEEQPPSEERQIQSYTEIFEAMAGRPVIVRTLDIGGDKPPSYIPFPEEMNPFLGWRAVRISLDRPDLFRTQLRAILRAAAGHQVQVMIPMITGLEELRRARALMAEAQASLQRDGLDHAADVPLGIMVETPAAAVLVDVLAREADFFSLGTNDLTQYTLAVDRGNATVAGLFQPLHPAVLRLIRTAIGAAHRADRWIGMCGELAGMRKAIPILLGLGLDEFSMAPGSIPEAKEMIGRLTIERAQAIAERALALGTAEEVEAYMREEMEEKQ
jgi:phosphotransferase system enzyme I (PtsI)